MPITKKPSSAEVAVVSVDQSDDTTFLDFLTFPASDVSHNHRNMLL